MKKEKTLTILRHAKAENGTAGQEDITRQLAPRGMEAASVMGAYMARNRFLPDKILCSSAVRTCQTLQYVQEAHPALPKAEYSDKLYHASAGAMLDMLSATKETVGSVLLVGHNPGVHQLCLQLAGEGDEKLLDRMTLKFPTCAMATIGFSGLWADIPHIRGALEGFVTPSMLLGVDAD